MTKRSLLDDGTCKHARYPSTSSATVIPPEDAPADVGKAVILMLISTAFFAIMTLTIRLATETLHPFEVAFFRNFFGLVFALPLLQRHGFGLLKTDKFWLYLTRCTVGLVSMFCMFWAIANLPLAQAVTISYSAPLFVTIGAIIFLGEQVRLRRWLAVILGFVGVIIIIRPFSEAFTIGAVVALIAAFLRAMVTISIKYLSRTEKPDAIVMWTALLWTPMALIPALMVWKIPQGWAWLWIVSSGALGTAGHLLWTRALEKADASLLTPIGFAQVPFVAFFGWVLFGEVLTMWLIIGATIIFVSNAYIARREAVLAKRAKAQRLAERGSG